MSEYDSRSRQLDGTIQRLVLKSLDPVSADEVSEVSYLLYNF